MHNQSSAKKLEGKAGSSETLRLVAQAFEDKPVAMTMLSELVEATALRVVELLDLSPKGPEGLIGGTECCQLLGVSIPTLRKLREAGLPHHRVGDAHRYRASEVLEWTREGGK